MSNTKEKVSINSHSHVSLYASMKTLKGNISEVYQDQVDCLKDWESYDKNYLKKKVNHLLRLHEAMQEELKTDHIKNKS